MKLTSVKIYSGAFFAVLFMTKVVIADMQLVAVKAPLSNGMVAVINGRQDLPRTPFFDFSMTFKLSKGKRVIGKEVGLNLESTPENHKYLAGNGDEIIIVIEPWIKGMGGIEGFMSLFFPERKNVVLKATSKDNFLMARFDRDTQKTLIVGGTYTIEER